MRLIPDGRRTLSSKTLYLLVTTYFQDLKDENIATTKRTIQS